MATVFDVAKYILDKYGSMSAMKLQKLIFYSQAMSLVWDDVPLFEEDFEAWAKVPFAANFSTCTRENLCSITATFLPRASPTFPN